MKKIITIQHTQSIHHTNGMVGSWTDWELTEAGKQQAENIGRNLSAELSGRKYKIYSSDLMRAWQTAEPLARYMGVKIEQHKELREFNAGEAVGKTSKWAKENALSVNSFDDRQFHNAETWREFWNRISDYCEKIVKDEAENIIIVSHGMFFSVWQAVWLGMDIHEFKYSGFPGGVSFMTIDDDGIRRIDRWNDEGYIKELHNNGG
ncbi:MAG: histidine phosphatase family protein [Clostridia bacterium]|nr:histidine phosphatase family protein [Clostridia bacterium]